MCCLVSMTKQTGQGRQWKSEVEDLLIHTHNTEMGGLQMQGK